MKITKTTIKTWISTHAAAEFEEEKIVYYLHIKDDGSIADDVSAADASFTCELSPEDFGLTPEEYATAESPEPIYAHEVDGDPVYEQIVDDLLSQATAYLADLHAPAIEPEDYWLGNLDIPVYRVGGQLYALDGWNGEEYTRCWKCIGPLEADPDDRTYTLRPITRAEEEGIDLDTLEEDSPEWDAAIETVGFHVC